MEIFLTHLPRVEVRPVTSGSKRHMLLLTLARTEGATPEDLSTAVGWTTEAALTGVRWDVVHELGYGIGRDRRGRLHLVLPPGIEEILTAAHRGVGTWLRERFASEITTTSLAEPAHCSEGRRPTTRSAVAPPAGASLRSGVPKLANGPIAAHNDLRFELPPLAI